MAVTKLRKAMKREQTCVDCNTAIKIGEKYFDSDEKLTNKPFPTAKRCEPCGNKLIKK